MRGREFSRRPVSVITAALAMLSAGVSAVCAQSIGALDAMNYVAGNCLGDDVSERNFQRERQAYGAAAGVKRRVVADSSK